MSCHDRDGGWLSRPKASKSAEDELRLQTEALCKLGAGADWAASGTRNLRIVLRGHNEDVRRVALEQVALQRWVGSNRGSSYSEGQGAHVYMRICERSHQPGLRGR